MNYSDEKLHEAAETLIRADEIHNDRELMKALRPFLKEKFSRMENVLSLKELWEKGKKRAAEEEYNAQFKSKLSNDDEESDNDADPLSHEKLRPGKS